MTFSSAFRIASRSGLIAASVPAPSEALTDDAHSVECCTGEGEDDGASVRRGRGASGRPVQVDGSTAPSAAAHRGDAALRRGVPRRDLVRHAGPGHVHGLEPESDRLRARMATRRHRLGHRSPAPPSAAPAASCRTSSGDAAAATTRPRAEIERRGRERRILEQLDREPALAHEQLRGGDVHGPRRLQGDDAVDASCGEVAERECERAHHANAAARSSIGPMRSAMLGVVVPSNERISIVSFGRSAPSRTPSRNAPPPRSAVHSSPDPKS